MRRLDRLALSVLALGCLGNFAAAQAPTELTGGSPVPAQQSLPPAAVLTPPDPISQIALALPTIGLYELSIFAVKLAEKRHAAATSAPAAGKPA